MQHSSSTPVLEQHPRTKSLQHSSSAAVLEQQIHRTKSTSVKLPDLRSSASSSVLEQQRTRSPHVESTRVKLPECKQTIRSRLRRFADNQHPNQGTQHSNLRDGMDERVAAWNGRQDTALRRHDRAALISTDTENQNVPAQNQRRTHLRQEILLRNKKKYADDELVLQNAEVLFEEVRQKLNACKDHEKHHNKSTHSTTARRRSRMSMGSMETSVLLAEAPCKLLVPVPKRLEADLARRIQSQRTRLNNGRQGAYDQVPMCLYQGKLVPDPLSMQSNMRSNDYYLRPGAADLSSLPNQEDNRQYQDFLNLNRAPEAMQRMRRSVRQRAIMQRKAEHEEREEKAQSRFAFVDEFAEAERLDSRIAKNHLSIAERVHGSRRLPLTPAVWMQVQWFIIRVAVQASGEIHRKYKIRSALLGRIQSPQCIQQMWRARQTVRHRKRMRAMRRQLKIAVWVTVFANKIIKMWRLRTRAAGICIAILRRGEMSTDVRRALDRFRDLICRLQRGVRKIARKQKDIISVLKELWDEAEKVLRQEKSNLVELSADKIRYALRQFVRDRHRKCYQRRGSLLLGDRSANAPKASQWWYPKKEEMSLFVHQLLERETSSRSNGAHSKDDIGD
eukprot:gnl/MRDRNA2_/MRDRNA2_155064_c0_seq1.p1 gnl/MRDRNA2_/MRDRNA2_155064_c0~~gnl/MRDRNA2_/MRDRNA2_155064_c0_seq1.p1  ORF type:complete len:618 (+),score=99.93 gnl/MRDRNA2_/MRDRNA2_155064_c0_seq1:170-2023(+)